MKKTIEGELFHEIEEWGNKKYVHIGDEGNKSGGMLASLVLEIGMKKKAKLTIQLSDEKEEVR